MDNVYYKGTQKAVVLSLRVLMELMYLSGEENTATPAQRASTDSQWKEKKDIRKSKYQENYIISTWIPSWSIG